MAARKSVQEKQVEQLMTKHLNEIGRKTTVISARTSRVRTGDLRDSQNYRVRPFNVLTLTQNWYGKKNYPKGKNSGDKNALAISIKQNVPDGVKLLVKDMIDLLKSPIQLKK